MKILVACEESQAVTIELRKLGHEAYSCDIMECSGGHTEWHIQKDIFQVINGHCSFYTRGNKRHEIDGSWDMVIAFPPCTDLASSGARWFEQKRQSGRQQRSVAFFKLIALCKCEKVAIENPVGIMSTEWRKPDQIINPWQFGHMEQKKTCLWLKNLPLLTETNNVYEEMMKLPKNKRERLHYLAPGPERAKMRSKTFPGIARAMATQWAGQVDC